MLLNEETRCDDWRLKSKQGTVKDSDSASEPLQTIDRSPGRGMVEVRRCATPPAPTWMEAKGKTLSEGIPPESAIEVGVAMCAIFLMIEPWASATQFTASVSGPQVGVRGGFGGREGWCQTSFDTSGCSGELRDLQRSNSRDLLGVKRTPKRLEGCTPPSRTRITPSPSWFVGAVEPCVSRGPSPRRRWW